MLFNTYTRSSIIHKKKIKKKIKIWILDIFNFGFFFNLQTILEEEWYHCFHYKVLQHVDILYIVPSHAPINLSTFEFHNINPYDVEL